MSMSTQFHTVQYWKGNPSTCVDNGVITYLPTTKHAEVNVEHLEGLYYHQRYLEGAMNVAATANRGGLLIAPCIPKVMSPWEFCDFLSAGARDVEVIQVLHGPNPLEYMSLLYVKAFKSALRLIDIHDGQRYYAVENNICRLHLVWHIDLTIFPSTLPDGPQHDCPRKDFTFRSEETIPRGISIEAALPSKGGGLDVDGDASLRCETNKCEIANEAKGNDADAVGSENRVPHGHVQRLMEVLRIHKPPSYCAVCLDGFEQESLEPIELVVSPVLRRSHEDEAVHPMARIHILCGHAFHISCLRKWCDQTCPVCRYVQYPSARLSCEICGSSSDVHVCLICGFAGCGENISPSEILPSFSARLSDRYSTEAAVTFASGHAYDHYKDSQHAYFLQAATQLVLDMGSFSYVHRIIQNKVDDKLFALASPTTPSGSSGVAEMSRGFTVSSCGGVLGESIKDNPPSVVRKTSSDGGKDVSLNKKPDSMFLYFNKMLQAQLASQADCYEQMEEELIVKFGGEIERLRDKIEERTATNERIARDIEGVLIVNSELQSRLETCREANATTAGTILRLEKLRDDLLSRNVVERDDLRQSIDRCAEEIAAKTEILHSVQREIDDIRLHTVMASTECFEKGSSFILGTSGGSAPRQGNKRRG